MAKKIAIAIWLVTALLLGILVLNYYGNRNLIERYGSGVYQQNELGFLGFTQPYINHFNRGNVFFQLGDYQKAKQEYQSALNLKPGDPYDCKVRVNYALSYVKPIDVKKITKDNYKDTIEICETAKSILSEKDCATENNDGHVVVYFLSDGENTDDHRLDNFSDIAEGIEGGAILGYGTAKGGQMTYHDDLHNEDVLVEDKRDYPYKPAVSKIDEKNLKQIASDLNIEYIHMDQPEDLDDTIDNVMKLLDKQQEESTEYGYADVYYWFVIPLAALLAYEFISVKRRT